MEQLPKTGSEQPIFAIKGANLSWRRIQALLGRAEYPLKRKEDPGGYRCGLADGEVEYKIFSIYEPYVNKDDIGGSSVCHIYKHTDGTCTTGALDVEGDNAWAAAVAELIEREMGKGGSDGSGE